jgi:hypothetical protein
LSRDSTSRFVSDLGRVLHDLLALIDLAAAAATYPDSDGSVRD